MKAECAMEGTSTMLRKATFLIFSLFVLAGPVMADTLLVKGVSGSDDSGFPQRGLSKSRVTENFGEPQQRTAAVGDPPISRWEYESFVVFFEYDHVVHAVSRRP